MHPVYRFKMNILIESPTSCEIRAVIRFLNAKKSYCRWTSLPLVWCLWTKCYEWWDVLGSSKMAEQTCTMKITVSAHPSWMTTLLEKSTTKFVKISGSQFQSYGRVFHKSHLQYSVKLWQRGCTTIKSVHVGCPKC